MSSLLITRLISAGSRPAQESLLIRFFYERRLQQLTEAMWATFYRFSRPSNVSSAASLTRRGNKKKKKKTPQTHYHRRRREGSCTFRVASCEKIRPTSEDSSVTRRLPYWFRPRGAVIWNWSSATGLGYGAIHSWTIIKQQTAHSSITQPGLLPSADGPTFPRTFQMNNWLRTRTLCQVMIA